MSVEEARRAVWQRFDQAAVWTSAECDEALDRLILEVKAGMQCLSAVAAQHETTCWAWRNGVYGNAPHSRLCETCAARGELISMGLNMEDAYV
jgi:hypothetical protein